MSLVNELKYTLSFFRAKSFDAKDFYENIGKEHTWGNSNNCLNLGYWKNARTMDEANINLAHLVGERCLLNKDDNLLDIGCGFGDQDFYFNRAFDVNNISGLNITPSQVAFANHKSKTLGLKNIKFLEGSATQIPFEDNSFNKIIALESAFHFKTREMFFKEAYRVLSKSGKIVIADIIFVPNKNGIRNRLAYQMNKASLHYQTENMYGIDTYIKKMEDAGFKNINCESISFFVFPFFTKYLLENPDVLRKFFYLFQIWIKYNHLLNIKNGSFMDYVIISANKV